MMQLLLHVVIVVLVLMTCDANRLRKLEGQMKSMKAFQSFALTRLDTIEADVGSITDRVAKLEAFVNESDDAIGDVDSKRSRTEDNIKTPDVKPKINQIKNILSMYRKTFSQQKIKLIDVTYGVKDTLSVFKKDSSSVINSLVNIVNDHVKKSDDNISASLEQVNSASVESGRLLRSDIWTHLENISSEVKNDMAIHIQEIKQESYTTMYAMKSQVHDQLTNEKERLEQFKTKMETKLGKVIDKANEVAGIIDDKRSTIEDGIMVTIRTLHSSWNDWSAWSDCSKSCDRGRRSRHRKCSAPQPLTDSLCTGSTTDTETCVIYEFCPHWSEWTHWSQCSQTCDDGTITRDRTCQAPASLHSTCQGNMTESQTCVTSVVCPLVTCSNLDIVSTSRNPSTSAIAYDTEITYACVDGYTHTGGDLTRNCQADGHLSDNAPVCTRVSSCYDLQNKTGIQRSGLYSISTWRSNTTICVYCDMVTEGGGWTVFQRRLDGSVDFFRNFSEYENGFGSASGEYWLGLRTIQEMLGNTNHELRIDVEASNGSSGYDVYSNFRLQGDGYPFYVDNRIRSLNMSNANQLSAGHFYTPYGQDFSTFDHDQDQRSDVNCADKMRGAWWYNNCYSATLNGDYGQLDTVQGIGIIYLTFKGDYTFIRTTKMMFRHIGGY